jgi:cellulose synthase/poly-beta-1,6-N-acetylglucosamine synthase-like glycosyltransferase
MKSFLIPAIIGFNYFVIFFYGFVNILYTALMAIAFVFIFSHIRKVKYSPYREQQFSPEVPSVSVLIPAYNEGAILFRTIQSILNLTYPYREAIVINDGSTDDTLDLLIHRYKLKRIDLIYRNIIQTMPIRGFYYNKDFPDLLVIDKEKGGKSDALNCGTNASKSPYICSVDADTLMEPDALIRLMSYVMESTVPVVACGGMVRVINGTTIEDDRIKEIGLPEKWLPSFQIVEYLRSFLFGRVGLDRMRGTMILSGAFSTFEKQAVIDVDGFDKENVCEDMEIIVRIHKQKILDKKPYAIKFIMDPICWTEVPETLKQLGKQRRRWHLGLIQTMMKHKSMILNPRYGRVGMLAMPFFFFAEMLSPVVEILGYVAMIGAFIFGIINLQFFLLFLFLAIFYGVFLSVASVFLEEMTYQRYPEWENFFILLLFGVLENFGYRQINSFWRFLSFFQYLFGKQLWEYSRQRGSKGESAHAT